jgi:serine/threonine protein kinase
LQQRKLSASCIDLIQQMLTYNPKSRITAAGALAHRWFKENSSAKNH